MAEEAISAGVADKRVAGCAAGGILDTDEGVGAAEAVARGAVSEGDGHRRGGRRIVGGVESLASGEGVVTGVAPQQSGAACRGRPEKAGDQNVGEGASGRELDVDEVVGVAAVLGGSRHEIDDDRARGSRVVDEIEARAAIDAVRAASGAEDVARFEPDVDEIAAEERVIATRAVGREHALPAGADGGDGVSALAGDGRDGPAGHEFEVPVQIHRRRGEDEERDKVRVVAQPRGRDRQFGGRITGERCRYDDLVPQGEGVDGVLKFLGLEYDLGRHARSSPTAGAGTQVFQLEKIDTIVN